jgi:hypothetical protein
MRMMGAESVDYHRETIIERGDDFPGAALDYCGSRGETPLAWCGSGAASLGLAGAVDNPSYDALYGPGGATDPVTGERLVVAKRPGMELEQRNEMFTQSPSELGSEWECLRRDSGGHRQGGLVGRRLTC